MMLASALRLSQSPVWVHIHAPQGFFANCRFGPTVGRARIGVRGASARMLGQPMAPMVGRTGRTKRHS